MTRFAKSFLPVALLTICTLSLRPTAAHAQGFSGHYKVTQGVNPAGGTYNARVVVEPRETFNVYRIHTKVGDAPPTHSLAILSGDTLAAGWSDTPGYGVVVYRVEGGRLTGAWLADSSGDEMSKEVLEGPPGLDGTYTIVEAYSAGSGEPYDGTVEIHPKGDVYTVTWTTNGYVYYGVGILKDDLFIASWGSKSGVAYYKIDGDGLAGIWSHLGAWTTGTENLVRLEKKKK